MKLVHSGKPQTMRETMARVFTEWAKDTAKQVHDLEHLKDPRLHANLKSFQVVDTLSVIAQKDALRDDDWARIEALAHNLVLARRAEAGEA